MQTLNQIKQFDKEYQNIYEEKLLNGRAGACMMCGIGVSLMLLPVGLGDFVWCILVLGGTFCAVGVELYMLRWLHIGNKLKFMPVNSAQIRKIRCRYLRRICLWLAAAALPCSSWRLCCMAALAGNRQHLLWHGECAYGCITGFLFI